MELAILEGCERGALTRERGFEELYALYRPTVLGWLVVTAGRGPAEDLAQDVWTVFHRRWGSWRHDPASPDEGRPVLSFLYRTAHFVLRGHRRRRELRGEPLESADPPDERTSPEVLDDRLAVGRLLELARRLCPPEELDVLLARLSGLSGREIAAALGITAAAADHRYRSAVERLRDATRGREAS